MLDKNLISEDIHIYQVEYSGIENKSNINIYHQILSIFKFID
jgi:hypothetical protein